VRKGPGDRTPIAPRARTLRTEQRAPPGPDDLPGFRFRTPDGRTALADGIASGLTWSSGMTTSREPIPESRPAGVAKCSLERR
jgi:hypothetical protein